MALIIATIAGVTAASLVHWFSWYTRLHHLSWAMIMGFLSATCTTLFAGIYIWPWPYQYDMSDMVLDWLIRLWAYALLIGYLQARSLPAKWWKGVLSVFYEAGLALLIIVVANASSTLQVIGEQLGRIRIQNIEYYSFHDATTMIFFGSLAVLAVIRPLIRIYRAKKEVGR